MTHDATAPKPKVSSGPWPEPKIPLPPTGPPRQAVRPKRHKARTVKSNRVPPGRGTHVARASMQGFK